MQTITGNNLNTWMKNLQMANSYSIALDFKNLILTSSLLSTIWKNIKHKQQIRSVMWGTKPTDVKSLKTIHKIQDLVATNISNFRYSPNYKVLSILSLHVYEDHAVGDKVELTEHPELNRFVCDWKILDTISHKKSDFYANIYVNNNNQMVLAFRGTIFNVKDLFTKNSDVKTDIDGIIKGEVVKQQILSYTATSIACALAKKKYTVTLTGHSLGGWLAQIGEMFCKQDFSTEARAVVFDSPGAHREITRAQSNIKSHETSFDPRNYKITHLILNPNWINCCNKRFAGKVYHIRNAKVKPSFWGKAVDLFFKGASRTFYEHHMINIVKAIDDYTAIPDNWVELQDMPLVECKTSKDVKFVRPILEKALYNVPFISKIPFGAKTISYLVDALIPDIGISSICNVILLLLTGKISLAQFKKYYNLSNDLETQKNSSKECSLKYEGHYRAVNVNLYKGVLHTDNKGSGDWFLYHIKRGHWGGESPLENQLKGISMLYTIKAKNGKEYVHTTKIPIKDLKDRIELLAEMNPDLYSIVLKHENTKDKNIINNLPIDGSKTIIEREGMFEKITNVLSKGQAVIIHAFEGTGKSALACEYANRSNKSAWWFDGSSRDKVEEGYRQLAEIGFNIDSRRKNINVLQMHLKHKLSTSQDPYIFIFDDVVDKAIVLDAYKYLPQNVKIIITTTHGNLLQKETHENKEIITLSALSIKEAKRYIKTYLNNVISDDDIALCIKACKQKHTILPKLLEIAVQKVRNHFEPCAKIFIKVINNDTTLINDLDKNSLSWRVLLIATHLDRNFIPLKVCKMILNDEKDKDNQISSTQLLNDIRNNLVSSSFAQIIRNEEFKLGLRVHRMVIQNVQNYIKQHTEEKKQLDRIKKTLSKTYNSLMPDIAKSIDKKQSFKKTRILAQGASTVTEDIIKQDMKIMEKDDILLLEKMASYQYQTGKVKKALAAWQTVLKAKEHHKIAKEVDKANLLLHIAKCHIQLEDLKSGKSCLNQVLDIWKNIYTKKNISLIDAKEAEHVILEEIGTLSSDHYKVLLGYIEHKLGAIFEQEEHLDVAIKKYKKSLAAINDTKHPLYFTNIKQIAHIHERNYDYQEAYKFFKKALFIGRMSQLDESILAPIKDKVQELHKSSRRTRENLLFDKTSLKQ